MKKTIITLIVLVLVGVGIYYFTKKTPSVTPVAQNQPATTTAPAQTETKTPVDTTKTVIGTSVEKNPITAYHYGTGNKELLFVGGIHGGYEWNTILLAYELMDYLAANPAIIPSNIKVTVIPVLNPDGLKKVVGSTDRFARADVSTSPDTVISGRFNANSVDLSRNFDCDWQSKATWMETTVSGGAKAFSEPESQALKSYVESHNPTAVVVWYSSAGGVFSSSCGAGIMPETRTLTNTYATASKYKAYSSFDFYKTTGDAVNWLAKKNIPAVSVILTTHQDTEFDKNLAGVKALIAYYAK